MIYNPLKIDHPHWQATSILTFERRARGTALVFSLCFSSYFCSRFSIRPCLVFRFWLLFALTTSLSVSICRRVEVVRVISLCLVVLRSEDPPGCTCAVCPFQTMPALAAFYPVAARITDLGASSIRKLCGYWGNLWTALIPLSEASWRRTKVRPPLRRNVSGPQRFPTVLTFQER